jgi:hypothetical protein
MKRQLWRMTTNLPELQRLALFDYGTDLIHFITDRLVGTLHQSAKGLWLQSPKALRLTNSGRLHIHPPKALISRCSDIRRPVRVTPWPS